MEARRDYKSTNKHDRYTNTTTTGTTFSSTLLDSIYKSIDENSYEGDSASTKQERAEFFVYRETMRKKQTNTSSMLSVKSSKEEELANLKRACLIEKWMEKKKLASTEKIAVVPRPVVDFQRNTILNSSSSSNSDSSFSLSSSEAESTYAINSSNFKKPKPIRTSISSGNTRETEQYRENNSSSRNNFAKTKLRALKIYSDLKKAKQPISPGGRLTSFLNSLFANGSSKKTKLSVNSEKIKSNSAYSSTCSSTSSFSRSCLSKTPSSSGKTLSGIAKRSVRFDDDFGFMAVRNLRNVPENERDVAVVKKNYERNINGDFDMKINVAEVVFDDDDDDDDDMSCASSDLFELDNLATIGIDHRYNEELPVYETTHFGMNVAISKGVFV